MASSILGWISRKAAAKSHNYSLITSPDYSLLRGVINGGRCAATRRTMSVVSNGTLKSRRRISSPWLMLPPEAGDINNDNNMNMVNYKFYSLAENKVLNFGISSKRVGADHIELVSSSHGWLSLFNRRYLDLFLFNPLSGRQITLPPIYTLPIPQKDLSRGVECVSKVITSCSPEQEDCRVMMSFGLHDRLAFCSPSSSSAEWTPIGAWYYKGEDDHHPIERGYQDFVYSSRQNCFYCITNYAGFEAWNLQDTGCPMIREIDPPSADEENYPWAARSEKEMELKKLCTPYIYLVVAEESGDIFWVRRHVMKCMALDGSYVDINSDDIGYTTSLPHKTIGFDVHKYDPEKCALVYMDGGSLDGLAFFIGNNHSFALSASEFPELKPNSIYFTDPPHSIHPHACGLPYGGHDLGIFNYEDQTFSPCYYPCDRQSIRRIVPAPMWFTPTPQKHFSGSLIN